MSYLHCEGLVHGSLWLFWTWYVLSASLWTHSQFIALRIDVNVWVCIFCFPVATSIAWLAF